MGSKCSKCCLSILIQTKISFNSLHLEPNHKLVYNEISTAGFESLICDYKQEPEGKTDIVWWKVKPTKSRP